MPVSPPSRFLIGGWVYEFGSIAHLRRELLRNGSLRLRCGIPSSKAVPSEDTFEQLVDPWPSMTRRCSSSSQTWSGASAS